jgi:hypothetical protein
MVITAILPVQMNYQNQTLNKDKFGMKQ